MTKAEKNEFEKFLRAMRKEAGLCPICGQAPDSGFVYCAKCRARNARANALYRTPEISRVRRQLLKSKGLCIRCGHTPATPGYVTCPTCRDKHNQAARLAKGKTGI